MIRIMLLILSLFLISACDTENQEPEPDETLCVDYDGDPINLPSGTVTADVGNLEYSDETVSLELTLSLASNIIQLMDAGIIEDSYELDVSIGYPDDDYVKYFLTDEDRISVHFDEDSRAHITLRSDVESNDLSELVTMLEGLEVSDEHFYVELNYYDPSGSLFRESRIHHSFRTLGLND